MNYATVKNGDVVGNAFSLPARIGNALLPRTASLETLKSYGVYSVTYPKPETPPMDGYQYVPDALVYDTDTDTVTATYREELIVVPDPVTKSIFTPLEWETRFINDEMWAMAELAKLERPAFRLMRQMDRAEFFDVTDPRTIAGMNYVGSMHDADGVEPYNLLPSPTRVTEILTPEIL